jgi:hypothetical protein
MKPEEAKIIKDAVITGAADPAFWLRFFLNHWFPAPFAPFHLGIIALVTRKVEFLNKYTYAHDFLLKHFKYASDPRDPESVELPVFQLNDGGKFIMAAGPNNNIIVPRGFSKTTLLNGINLYELCVDGTIFNCYISSTATHAETQLGNVKFELETNTKLHIAYGNLVPDKSDPERWTNDQLQLLNGGILIARGRGGQVRGLNYRARRPNRITIDDIEDEKSIKSPLIRKETSDWFYASVMPAGNEMAGAVGDAEMQKPLQVNNLGTLLGPECLVMDLSNDLDFNTVRFGSVVDDETMLWDYKQPRHVYEQKRAAASRNGKLAQFVREYDSLIRVSDESIFPAVFIYQPTTRADMAAVAQALDPAISGRPGADHCALVTVGRRLSDGALWILDEWGGIGKTPREVIDQYFLNYAKWQPTHSGIEAQQYQAALVHLMREEMMRRNVVFNITPIVQGKDDRKDDRIIGVLSPRYMNGFIRHLRPLPGLEGNLNDWPNGKKDYADAASMAFTLIGATAGLVLPEEFKSPTDYGPAEDQLPPAFVTAGNHYIFHNQQRMQQQSRYRK